MLEIDRLLTKLSSLIGDKFIKDECRIYRLAYRRLASRFRNNIFVSKLKQVITFNKKLQTNFKPELFQSIKKKLYKKNQNIENLLNIIIDLIKFLDQYLDLTLDIYCQAQTQLKVGHLVHHLIVITSSIARLRICHKAILVYSSDIFMEIQERKNEQDVIDILSKHGCKPKNKQNEYVVYASDNRIQEQLGQLIDRKTMKPV